MKYSMQKQAKIITITQEINIKIYEFQNILQANVEIGLKLQTIQDLLKIRMINLKSIVEKVQQANLKPNRRIIIFLLALLPSNQYRNIFYESIRCLIQSFSIQYIYKNVDIIAYLCKDQIPKHFNDHLSCFYSNEKLAAVLHGSILQISNQQENIKRNNNSFVIITGGTRGIGRQTSKVLAKTDKNLILTSRKIGQNVRLFAQQLQKNYEIKVVLLELDLQNSQSCRQFSQQILKLGAQIQGIVHNGGVGTKTCLQQSHLCQPEQTLLKVNSLGPMILHEILDQNKVINKTSKITIISSVGATRGFSEMNQIDLVSKAILEPWAEQLSKQGWSISIIYPGATDTDMFQKSTTNKLKQDNILQIFQQKLPKGFIIRPQLIAQTIGLSLNTMYRNPFKINRFMASCGMFIDFRSLPNVGKEN